MKQLLFINTPAGAKPLSSRTPRERSTILRHVQGNRRRAEVLRNQAIQQQPWSGYTSVLPSHASKHEPSLEFSDADGKSHDETAASIPPPPLLVYSPHHNAYDPFHCTAVGSDAGTHALLHTTFHVAARGNFLAESFAPSSSSSISLSLSSTTRSRPRRIHRHERIFTSRLQQCVHDPSLMYATLAYGSAFLGWTMGGLSELELESRALGTKSTDYFLGRALSAVRTLLSTSPHSHSHSHSHRRECETTQTSQRQTQKGMTRTEKQWLLLSIHALSLTEMWLGMPNLWIRHNHLSSTTHPEKHAVILGESETRLATCRVHLQALLHAVCEWGGWEEFDPYLLDSVVLLDKYLAVFCGSRPVLMTETWDPGPLSECGLDLVLGELAWEGVLPRLGTAFQGKMISNELKTTLQEIVEYCRVAETAWSKGRVDLAMEQYLFRRLQALIHRLLHLFHDLPGQFVADRCVCLAGVIFLHTCLCHDGPQRSAKVAAQHLRRLLTVEAGIDKHDEESPLDEPLLDWFLVMGALVPGPSLDKTWFITKLAETKTGRRWDGFVEELGCFLFLPQRQLVAFNDVMDAMSLVCGRLSS